MSTIIVIIASPSSCHPWREFHVWHMFVAYQATAAPKALKEGTNPFFPVSRPVLSHNTNKNQKSWLWTHWFFQEASIGRFLLSVLHPAALFAFYTFFSLLVLIPGCRPCIFCFFTFHVWLCVCGGLSLERFLCAPWRQRRWHAFALFNRMHDAGASSKTKKNPFRFCPVGPQMCSGFSFSALWDGRQG